MSLKHLYVKIKNLVIGGGDVHRKHRYKLNSKNLGKTVSRGVERLLKLETVRPDKDFTLGIFIMTEKRRKRHRLSLPEETLVAVEIVGLYLENIVGS